MSNRRVKSLGVDEDELDYDDSNDDEYDEGDEEVSPDDQEQLRLGTVRVRQALGPRYQVGDKEVQDALWNYYYDVDKTVALIKGRHKPKNTTAKTPNHHSPSPFQTAKDFFHDCPWQAIPLHRRADIMIEPTYQTRGLLGGAPREGKMSKLAALAAKRRKDNTQSSDQIQPAGQTTVIDDYAANLNKLSITSDSYKERRRKAEATTHQQVSAQEAADRGEPQPPSSNDRLPQGGSNQETEAAVERTTASMFASTFAAPAAMRPSLPDLTSLGGVKTAQIFNFKDPSPDDVVFRAQTASTIPAHAKVKAKETPKATNGVTSGVNNLSISDSIKIKGKNLDVLAEYSKVKRKNAANFVVIGHVDAGKSTLMGRLLFDLKAVDERTMEKYRKEAESIGKGSFAFAWVLDQGTEERERGVTIDIAQNKFSTDKTDFTILDAPGHQDFVPNMIAGASAADFAMLVIDASPGNFESGLKGQTREHALLARSIGVQRLIVAVNKMDTVSWSQGRFREIEIQTAAFLRAANYKPDSTILIPCSGLEGGNVLTRTTAPEARWYTGPTIVEALDAFEPTTHALEKPLRMTIADVFRGGVQNPLSTSGRIEAGSLQIGDQVLIQPSSEKATIRAIELDGDYEPRDWAVAGQNVILHLADIDAIHLRSGDVICSPSTPVANIDNFTAQLLAFSHLTPMTVDVHRGRLHVPGRISQLIAILDKKTGEVTKKRPKIVQPEQMVRVQVQLDHAVPLELSSRIILRNGGTTVAAGLLV